MLEALRGRRRLPRDSLERRAAPRTTASDTLGDQLGRDEDGFGLAEHRATLDAAAVGRSRRASARSCGCASRRT